MRHNQRPTDDRTQRAVRRLLDAVDRSLTAAREVEAARAELEQAATATRLRVHTAPDRSPAKGGRRD
jgi:hypothetical protein